MVTNFYVFYSRIRSIERTPTREMLKCLKTKRGRTPKHSHTRIQHCCLLFVSLNNHAQKTCFSVMKLCFSHSVVISSLRLALSSTWQTPPKPWTKRPWQKSLFKICPFRNEKKTGKSKFSQGLLGVLLGTTKKKNGQPLTGRAPVTIPETIAENISAPDPFWFLRWQICRPSAYLNQNR